MPTAPLPADETRRAALLNELGVPGAAADTTAEGLIARALHLEAQHDRMADFARASGDWMWEVDADLRVIWLSGSFATATGLEAARLLGHSLAELPMLDPDGLELPGQTLGPLLHQQAGFSRVVTPLVAPTGSL